MNATADEPVVPPTSPQPPPPPPPNLKDERNWAMFCHLGALAGYVLPVPAMNVIVPLILWNMKRRESAFVDDQGREALNFQITVTLAVLVCIPLMFVCVGIPLAIAAAIADIVFTIIAAIKAADGVRYRYPICLRLVK